MAPAITVTSDSDSLKNSLTSDPSGPTLEANGPHPPAAAPFLKMRTAGPEHTEEPMLPEDDLLQQVLKTMEEGKEVAGGPNMFQLFNTELELLEPLAKQPTEEPEQLVEGQLTEVLARQHALQRRYDRLLRIIRKKQARNVGFHTGLQIYEMVTTTKAYMKARSAALRLHTSTDELLDADHVNGMSPKALASLVKQFVTPTMNPSLADTLSSEQAAVISSGSGQLGHRLQHVEAEFDSDMTASSSGGDSCDENTGFNVHNTRHLPVYKRAAWRFARERASAASRWSWLMANIAELEYRIRQLIDYQRQLRSNKGTINLGSPSQQSSKEGEVQMMNGHHCSEEDESSTACRVKPLDLKSFRKRKLFVPGMLTPKTGKRLCQSQNQPPCCRDTCSMPCVLCFPKKVAPSANQAYQSVLPPDVGGRESLRERAARLDPAIHPVLSGSQDVSRSLHMAALLRQPGWQQSQLRQKGLARLGLGLKKTRLPVGSLDPSHAPAQSKRKYKKNNSAASALSAKLRKKAKARKKLKRLAGNGAVETGGSLKKSLRLKKTSVGEGGIAYAGFDDEKGILLSEAMRQVRKKRESSYDIDNIVIPYSMAALTRVEKLEYKEILTPKWRISEILPAGRKAAVNNKSVQSRSSSVEESEVEDISDEAMVQRHEPLEIDEKRKFRCAPRNSIRGGVRARRTDSRAESSGANTPDPMSPMQAEDSPLTSPRATPLPLSIFHDDLSRTSNSSKGRRRTTSLQAPLEPFPFEAEAAPFEPRVFPLTDEQCEQMVAAETHQPPLRKVTVVPEEFESMGGAAPASPCSSDSTESALPEDDPEWTLDEPSEDEEAGAAAAALAGRADPPYRPRRSH